MRKKWQIVVLLQCEVDQDSLEQSFHKLHGRCCIVAVRTQVSRICSRLLTREGGRESSTTDSGSSPGDSHGHHYSSSTVEPFIHVGDPLPCL